MGEREVLLLVNDKAGTIGNKENIENIASRLSKESGLRLSIEHTSQPGDARRLAEEFASTGGSLLLVAGGDGTVRDAASGLWRSDTVLGIIPSGSGNGLARSLGLPKDPEKAVELALTGKPRLIDRGIVNGEPFYCAFGIGFDAEVAFKFSQHKKRGRAMYVRCVLEEMLRYRPERYHITSDGREFAEDALLVAVCNCTQYGNDAFIAPKAVPDDGLLDITVVRNSRFAEEMRLGYQLMKGQLDRNPNVRMERGKSIVIKAENPTRIHLDGEPRSEVTEARIEVEREGLKAVCRGNVSSAF